MASNKDSKTSKTAHVMNLLSKNRNPEPAPQAEAPAPQAAEPTAPTAPAAPIPPIITSINADAAVASQIKDALEAALDPVDAPAQPIAPPPAPTPKPVPPAPQPVEAEPVFQTAVEAPAPAAPVPASQNTAPSTFAASADEYEQPAYINVMEVLVSEKAEKYMRASGVCCCDRCLVDVRAYALNHLPPKYVVMSKGEMIPKLTFYETQHSSDITTQLMRACDVVSKAPHHGRL